MIVAVPLFIRADMAVFQENYRSQSGQTNLSKLILPARMDFISFPLIRCPLHMFLQ